jgi:hypothetical protein
MVAGGIAELTAKMIKRKVTAVASNSILIFTQITADSFKYAGVFDKSIKTLCLSTNLLSALKALIVLKPFYELH